MAKKFNCSHKAIEWADYKRNKVPGDGKFPPIKYCAECEISKALKAN